jgi:hypothetical protein
MHRTYGLYKEISRGGVMVWVISTVAIAGMFLILILIIWAIVAIYISFTDDYTAFIIITSPFLLTLPFLNLIIQPLSTIIPFLSEILTVLATIVTVVIVWHFFNLIWR